MNWKKWLIGLLGAVINSVSVAGAAYITGLATDQATGSIQWERLGATCLIMAVLGVFLYLREHNLPEPWDGIDRRSIVPLLLITLLLGGAVMVQACAPKVWVLTPAGKTAYTATEIGKRIGRLSDTAIQAHDAGGLSDAIAVPIVLFSYHALKVLEATPEGWATTVAKAWAQLKTTLPGPVNPILAATWGAVDVILAAYQSNPGDVPDIDPEVIDRAEQWLAAQGVY